jgi:hypothetical protein
MAEPVTALTPAPTETVTAQAPMSFGGLHNPPQLDVIELLPPAAADKLRKLRLRRADAHRLIPEFEQIREASMARMEAENALKRLTDHPQNSGRGLPDTDPLVVAAKKHLDKMADDFRRLTELQEVRSAAFQSASAAQAAVESWLRDGRPHGTVLQDHDGEVPKLAKGEAGLLDAIENRRRRVRELRADLHRIASAPFPSSHAKARMRAQIEALAMQGAPSVSRLVELDGRIEFETQRLTSSGIGAERHLAFAEVPDAVALVAWLHKDALIAALDRSIADESDDGAALSHEARQKAEAETMSDLLSAERDESFFVWQAQAQNLPIEHRGDISASALLGLRLTSTARTTELPETSPGLSWPWRR